MNALEQVRFTDPTVHEMMAHGRDLEEIIVALVIEKNNLMIQMMKLHLIAPRKITLPDGRVMVWRCPDELVPEIP